MEQSTLTPITADNARRLHFKETRTANVYYLDKDGKYKLIYQLRRVAPFPSYAMYLDFFGEHPITILADTIVYLEKTPGI